MLPHSLNFNQLSPSPKPTPPKRILGEIQNTYLHIQSPIKSIMDKNNALNAVTKFNISPKNQSSHITKDIDENSDPYMSIESIGFNKCPINSQFPRLTEAKNSGLSPNRTKGLISNSPNIVSQKTPLTNKENSPKISSSLTPVNMEGISPKNSLYLRMTPLKTDARPYPRSLNSPKPSSPLLSRLKNSPIDRISPLSRVKRQNTKITRIFEERNKFKSSCKENVLSETFVKFDLEEETRDSAFSDSYQSQPGQEGRDVKSWSTTKLDFTGALQTFNMDTEPICVPEKTIDLEEDLDTLQDLEAEFENDNFDHCSKYEIISTDSPDIISRGRSAARKVNDRNFVFGAPLLDNEASTSFNKPSTATRVLNFEDEAYEFTSPTVKRCSSGSVKKSLKFSETPPKKNSPSKTPTRFRYESTSSIGTTSTFSSPASKVRLYTSESTASMESGFISELEEPFLEVEESNSPKVANLNDLLSGVIKTNVVPERMFQLRRPSYNRSLSFNPESSKAKVSLFSILESTEKRKQKRLEESDLASKRRKANEDTKPVLQRCHSENNASIMSALARSAEQPDLVGDFSRPYCLPLTAGAHSDLRSISCHTLAALLHGDYSGVVDQYQIIDCRYPYEFQGGHIDGAVNLHTPKQILTLLETDRDRDSGRRILIFHCELSQQRGPNLCRYLRAADRARHRSQYPYLSYPELYILEGGYKQLYTVLPSLCTPRGYTAMCDPVHDHLRRHHRQY